MIDTDKIPRRLNALAVAAIVLLCSGFRSSGVNDEFVGPPVRLYTRSVVCVEERGGSLGNIFEVPSPGFHAPEGLEAEAPFADGADIQAEASPGDAESLSTDVLDPHGARSLLSRINLRLTQHRWQALSLFGRNLAADLTANVVVDTMTAWSGAILDRFVKPVTTGSLEWVSRLNLRPTLADRTPDAPVLASTFSAGAFATASESNNRGSLSPSIVDGRMPSLASSMGSVLDPAMGLDDVSRSRAAGLQVGLRIERPLDSRPEERGVELQVVPGLSLDGGI